MLSDVYTPVGIYLRLRDRFRDTVLLESADNRAVENSFSFIGINAIGGIEISSYDSIEYKIPGQKPEKEAIKNIQDIPKTIWDFMNRFEVEKPADKAVQLAQGFYGYATYDAVQFFETIKIKSYTSVPEIPLMRYRLYQYVIAINHFKDELFLLENKIAGLESDIAAVESLIKSKDVPTYPFALQSSETSNMTDATTRLRMTRDTNTARVAMG